jgi:hypothetical protein
VFNNNIKCLNDGGKTMLEKLNWLHGRPCLSFSWQAEDSMLFVKVRFITNLEVVNNDTTAHIIASYLQMRKHNI